jgi:F-box domain
MGSGAYIPGAGGDDGQFALDALPDGCLTSVLEHVDVQSLLAMRGVSRRSQQLASQPALWR